MARHTHRTIERRMLWAIALNFAAFVAIAFVLGGDAINGRAEDGRYFLASYGTETEVTAAVWYYSQVHAALTFGSFIAYIAYRFGRRRFRR